VGSRPQLIKSGPVSEGLRAGGIDEVTVHAGQHYDRELSQVFFEELDLPDVDLFEGGNTGATSPAETGRNGNRAERAEPRMVSSSSSAALAIQSVS